MNDFINYPKFNCVSNVQIYGLDESIKRAKYPMSVDVKKTTTELTEGIKHLALSNVGEGHDQFLTGIIVQFDLTFTNKVWIEAERYNFLNFISSQSTMHKITKFNLDESYIEYVDEIMINRMKELVDEYNKEKNEKKKKELYLKILYSNPSGFKITAGMTTNYRQLKTIYHQRKNHKLPEWREFCQWIETLPYSNFIIGEISE